LNQNDDKPRAAMILAAGRGERMRPLTDSTPKPLLKVRGRPLIERHVEALASAGITRLVINLAWLGSQIRDYLGDGSRYGVRIVYSEETKPLETAGGIIRALPHLSPGPFAVVNGDIFTDYRFESLKLPPGLDAHLVLVANPPQHPAGDFGIVNGLAVDEGAERFTFSGIAVYREALFAGHPDGPARLKPLLVRSMSVSRCSAELFQGLWEDVGTAERLTALNA
jgi:MurNAc alpha-1-phosphate uridylyltransferase